MPNTQGPIDVRKVAGRTLRMAEDMSKQGNPPCADPMTCEEAPKSRAHVANYKRWLEAHGITVP